VAFWLDDGQGDWELIVREGDQAPGLAAGVLMDLTEFGGVRMPRPGALQVEAVLTGSGVNASNNVALWSYGDTGLQMLAREGNQAPGLPNGVVFQRLPIPTTVVVGPGIDSSNNTGIWLELRDDVLELVVREGEQAPGTLDGVVFASVQQFDLDFLIPPDGSVVQNEAAQFAFTAYLRGPGVTDANDIGLWASDRGGSLHLVARHGQQLDVDDGPGVDTRTIESIDAAGDYLNAKGQVLFFATFTDGSKGLFLSNQVAVPEASTFVYLASAMAMALLTRMGHRPKSRTNSPSAMRNVGAIPC
jgi:hypothetical protein